VGDTLPLRFENFSLDTDRRELRRAGDLVAVEPQVFDLIDYLVCRRERVVTKDELLDEIWAGRIVSESTLTSRINAARRALGDSGGTPRRRLVHMAKGLGLAPNLVIDQHFRRRDRLGRLLTALSYNPGLLGVGIDEDTAAIFDGSGVLSVLGAGSVTVVDAAGLRYTDSHAVHRGQPIAMMGLRVDVLTTGSHYDLERRAGIPPAETVRIDPLNEEELAEEEEAEEVSVLDGGE